jgi:hypothetical protein
MWMIKCDSAHNALELLTVGLFGYSLLGCGDDTAAKPATEGGVQDSSMTPDATKDSPSGGPETSTGDDGPIGTDAADGGPASEGGGVLGNIIIADQYNNRVIEIDRSGNIVWQFGDGNAVPGPTSVVGPNDCERLPNGQTLIAGTGVPLQTPQDTACTTQDAGCPDNRVLLVNQDGGIAWQYSQLNVPVFAAMLASGNVLITDQGNNRIVEVSADGGVAWQYGPSDGGLNSPNSAQRLVGGNTVIADEGNGRVIEIAQDGGVVWEYRPASADGGAIPAPAFASRLSSGNTLITDQGLNRILEVTPGKTVSWSYDTTDPRVDSGVSPTPTRAVRLANGHTLVSNQNYNQVFELDNSTPPKIVFAYGQLGVAGKGAGQLNGPYDAKLIGDYTGLTPPR